MWMSQFPSVPAKLSIYGTTEGCGLKFPSRVDDGKQEIALKKWQIEKEIINRKTDGEATSRNGHNWNIPNHMYI